MKVQKTRSHLGRRIYTLILYIIIACLSIALVGYSVILTAFTDSTGNITLFSNPDQFSLGLFDLIPVASDAITGKVTPLKGEDEGRTNILLLGKDPEAGLTDTMIVLSYFHEQQSVYTFSIPRDTVVNTKDIAGEKINGVVSIIDRYTSQDGRGYLTNLLERELDITLHYWASINIDGLAQAVDLVDGIDIEVSCTFTDYKYPAPNFNGFLRPAPTFTKGTETLDGERAVIYARSRKSLDCNEGSDFARSRRQSEVIQALLAKIQSQNLIENTLKIGEYFEVINDNLDTNFTLQELFSFGKTYQDTQSSDAFTTIAFTTEDSFLCNTQSASGAYIIAYGVQGNCGRYSVGNTLSNRYKTQLQNIIANPQWYNPETKVYSPQNSNIIDENSSEKGSSRYNPFR